MVSPLRDFASSYFNDIFVNCCAEGNFSNVQAHIWHLKQVFQFMQDNKLYANLKKCFFVHQKIRCWVVMRVNPEFELIRRRCHRSVLGIRVRILRNYDSARFGKLFVYVYYKELCWLHTAFFITLKERRHVFIASRASNGLRCSEEEPSVSLHADPSGRLQAISRDL